MGPGVGGIGTARELLLADDGTGAGVGGVGTGSVRHWTVDGDCTGWGRSTVYGDCMGDGCYVSDTQRTWSVGEVRNRTSAGRRIPRANSRRVRGLSIYITPGACVP
ncbi:uncharacterized protein ATNIH1004_009444 [Aspergillus tanneri]|uniref:Uncharacterized protein n=1 Tax=Aspergillus tanneri TaxID=1220188 RepID=A0A5M9M6L3_9EURO|nr:uncharacterized protein ATNIH1004_009444 [Aspergillus tanneri]KAA8642692.1 hypothetical protein ATNIH1004_009444 [Aspergillus tanneri]